MNLPVLLAAACGVAVCCLLVAERSDRRRARAIFKLAASSSFVGLALALGATDTRYGRWILAALVLGWVGDACLLSRASGWFMAGLSGFLLSHVAFTVAFLVAGVSPEATALALVLAGLAAVGVHRWLWPHLQPSDRAPVGAYVATIFVMCAAAVGCAAASGRWTPAAGAVLFAVSDLFVARDRFVAPAFANKAWGLPLYFLAQCLLASTV